MSNDGKKIAFSFSKVKKPALINKVNLESKEKVDYVDCFDGSKGKFSYKGNVKNEESKKPELVIPMPTSKTSTDIVKSRIENKLKNLETNGVDNSAENNSTKTSEMQPDSKNLEELAALEILKDINNGDVESKKSSDIIIEAKDLPEASDADIDYDNIPVTDFGLAMLRGMGWKPGLGIGKDPRLVEAASPKLRPKGLGLGAQISDVKSEKEAKSKDKKDEREVKSEYENRKDDRRNEKAAKSEYRDRKGENGVKSEYRDRRDEKETKSEYRDRKDERRYDREGKSEYRRSEKETKSEHRSRRDERGVKSEYKERKVKSEH